MALNPQYEAIGKGFVQQYYALFDDPAQRASLVNMYNVGISEKIDSHYKKHGFCCRWKVRL